MYNRINDLYEKILNKIDARILKSKDNRHFSNEYFKKLKHHDIYINTIRYYKKLCREQLIIEKMYLETQLSSEQQLTYPLVITLLFSFLMTIFTFSYQYLNNRLAIICSALDNANNKDYIRLIQALLKNQSEYFNFIITAAFFVFIFLYSLSAFLTIKHILNKQWLQKNLSAVNYLLNKNNDH